MDAIKRILVPTDFSAHADEAFRAALTLARATGAEVIRSRRTRSRVAGTISPVSGSAGGAGRTGAPEEPLPRERSGSNLNPR